MTSDEWRDLAWERADEIERLKAALQSIRRTSAPGTRTLDDFIRDMGWINDESRRALARTALEGSDEALFPTKKICPECGQRMREGDYCDHVPF